MKKILLLIPLVCFSCARRIGDLTMIATRNVDSKTEYVELKRYVKAKDKTIEEAVDKAIRDVPGGEFMKNVVIFSNGKIEGDVWGISGMLSEKEKKQEKKEAKLETIQEKEKNEIEEQKAEFEIGDKVSYKEVSKFNKIMTGEIQGKSDKYAIIKLDSGKLVHIKYSILVKVK